MSHIYFCVFYGHILWRTFLYLADTTGPNRARKHIKQRKQNENVSFFAENDVVHIHDTLHECCFNVG